jgi:hypothetical protein
MEEDQPMVTMEPIATVTETGWKEMRTIGHYYHAPYHVRTRFHMDQPPIAATSGRTRNRSRRTKSGSTRCASNVSKEEAPTR